ncbi:MAG: T9SS type A sorting domain-containing protein, partial [bacterium]
VVLLPFQFGNIPRGGGVTNHKEDLLVRMFDFAIMPLVDIQSALPADTLWVDTLYSLDYTVYDNRCVKKLVFEYSSDGGATWMAMNEIPNPDLDTVLTIEFSIPPSTGDNCLIRLIASDSTYNFTADTTEPFVVMNYGIAEGDRIPSAPYLRPFPNPFNAELSFDVYVDIDSKVQIFDIAGRMVAQMPVSSGESTLRWVPGRLPAGVYLARIANTGEAVKAVYLK